MFKQYYFLFGLLAVILSSCTIEQSTHFNKNMSGVYAVELETMDLGALSGDEDDKTKINDSLRRTITELAVKFNEVDGISQSESIVEEGDNVYGFRFNFKSIDALHKALESMGDEGQEGSEAFQQMRFVHDNKQLSLLFEEPETPMIEEDEMAQVAMLSAMIKLKYTLSFEQKVKVVQAPEEYSLGTNEDKDQTLTFDVDFSKFLKDPSSYNVVVKLK